MSLSRAVVKFESTFGFRSQLLFPFGSSQNHAEGKDPDAHRGSRDQSNEQGIAFARRREAGLATMSDEVLIGNADRYNSVNINNVPVFLMTADRRQHVHVIGKTGTGKTTLVKNMIVQHILAGDGVAFIDPHGDAAADLLNFIPPARTDDLIYFNPADMEFPIALNVLAKTDQQSHLIASDIRSAFRAIWKEFWGPRMDYILLNSLLSLLEVPETTLMDVLKILTNDRYRNWVVKQLRDPLLKEFWRDDFEMMDRRQRKEAIGPVENKIGQFVSSPLIRNIVGQAKRKIDFRRIIDGQLEFDPEIGIEKRRKFIFIANLSKGQLGDDKSNLLGALLISQFQLAAMQRATIEEDDRQDFYLFADEFQNFCTDKFETILSESRKFRLNLVLSHQYLEQLPQEMRAAVFGNVGTLISFRIGHADAEIMEREFGRTFAASDFTDLNRFEILIKPLSDGTTLTPFRAMTITPMGTRYCRRENLIRCSRMKYAAERRVVESKMEARLSRFQNTAI